MKFWNKLNFFGQRGGMSRSLLLAVVGCAWCVPGGCETVKSTVNSTMEAMTPAKPGRSEVERLSTEPELRVRVARQSTGFTLQGPQEFIVRGAGGAGRVGPATLSGPLSVTSGAKGIVTVDGSGEERAWGFGLDVEVLAGDGTPDGTAERPGESIRLDGRPLPGYVTLRSAWGENPARIDVMVTIPIEAYLPGVLAKELLKGWPRQTFEAQAVASRTYALQERTRARAAGKLTDVEDTTADQVFGGTGSTIVSVEAVRATRGWVLTENGSLIRAYFSSQCGGRPASAEHAWTAGEPTPFNKAGPLQASKRAFYCQPSPLHRWTQTRTAEDVTKRLKAWGKGKGRDVGELTKLRRIVAGDVNEAGRPNVYTVVSESEREYELAPEELREALNWPVPGLAPIGRENRVHSGDIEVSVVARDVRIVGRGFGHGVGMCQWCAKGMGDAGRDWRTMVELFYPRAEVRKLY